MCECLLYLLCAPCCIVMFFMNIKQNKNDKNEDDDK